MLLETFPKNPLLHTSILGHMRYVYMYCVLLLTSKYLLESTIMIHTNLESKFMITVK